MVISKIKENAVDNQSNNGHSALPTTCYSCSQDLQRQQRNKNAVIKKELPQHL
jgi:hypothetical protein